MRGKFKIGRFLHLKSEIQNRKLNRPPRFRYCQSNLSSDLRCRNRPISNFPSLLKGLSCFGLEHLRLHRYSRATFFEI